MRILNVAEKNDSARRMALLLSNGQYKTRRGDAANFIFEFPYWNPAVFGKTKITMAVMGVAGRLNEFEFTKESKKWEYAQCLQLFDAPIEKKPKSMFNSRLIDQLKAEVKDDRTTHLIIWTDNDVDGEHIGFEIIDACRKVKPSIFIRRARFSSITATEIANAIDKLEQPRKFLSDAVDCRSEFYLRVSAPFTRLQTLRFREKFPG